MADKFVFIVHALSPIHRRIMGLRGRKWSVALGHSDGSDPNEVHRICRFRYADQYEGEVIGIPMPPEPFLESQERALSRLIRAVHLSGRGGQLPSVIGLGSLCSVIAGRGESLQDHFDAPVTTGHAATTWCLYQNITQHLSQFGTQPVGLVGASSPVGTALAKLLAQDGVSIVVDSKRAARGISAMVVGSAELVAEQVKLIAGCATTGPNLELSSLRAGTHLYDISLPRTLNSVPDKKSDVTVWSGETMSMPSNWRRGFWGPIYHLISGYGWNTVLACLLEPLMVLASKEAKPFAQGRKIHTKDVQAFGETARALGFLVQPRQVRR